jgi:hypothetical protein
MAYCSIVSRLSASHVFRLGARQHSVSVGGVAVAVLLEHIQSAANECGKFSDLFPFLLFLVP